ncbi:hypothetical protein MGG_06159 [Pyricularia oryzae 70-15]|uniref:Tyrosine specific protein phosphatases domain-containing protein n=3 Tax=Pyricularia oryzae TaxID=318829 RepID=G4MZZ5_PYRO7|nr:uncharacterized protein MGG_06159 [Pyricularia oryzae 70-15]EHA52233.1 hypothetical protein MGG_06159 [Pyricularia oryzae 70-15]ELQ42832.1 hypothetical protein OOU_Y34scaffold00192g17 [Pyricularia oryzae Y34]KAI7916456.1 hypothetical protein M0657_008595 [Pyricularia oryzae]KAI7924950.1 hypothetical protein M9X92_003526 [Pyricularia oryzae]
MDDENRKKHGNVVATAPFERGPPEPPYIMIPALPLPTLSILPSFEAMDSADLSEADLRIITQNAPQLARDNTSNWNYDMRRNAQPILDFLHLGPWNSAKDRAYLEREGITMLLGVLDTRMAPIQVVSLQKAVQGLDIAIDHIDATNHQELIRLFPEFVRKVNDHMLSVYRKQAVQVPAVPGEMAIDPASFSRGKVLVFCDSGNERSALMVAGYIMNLFGVDVVSAVQFVNCQRFCTNFDEECKQWLRAYQDILEARRSVATSKSTGTRPSGLASNKRSIDQAYHEENDTGREHDLGRWMNREAFVPFIDGREKDIEMAS